MGALAKWGGVAGAAKGWGENVEAKRKEEAATIDNDRKMALERFRAKKAAELEGQRQKGASDLATQQADSATELERMRQSGATERTGMTVEGNIEGAGIAAESRENVALIGTGSQEHRQDDQQAFLAEENNLDRASRERIARLRASASASSVRAALERFEPRVLKTGETPEGMPAGYVVETDTPAVYDKQAGTWYVQEGNRYILPGTPPESIRRPGPGAEDNLFANPQTANSFLKTYRYLPMGFLSTLRAPAGTQGQGGMLSSGREAEVE